MDNKYKNKLFFLFLCQIYFLCLKFWNFKFLFAFINFEMFSFLKCIFFVMNFHFYRCCCVSCIHDQVFQHCFQSFCKLNLSSKELKGRSYGGCYPWRKVRNEYVSPLKSCTPFKVKTRNRKFFRCNLFIYG